MVGAHFVLESDSTFLSHTDVILPWLESQNMTSMAANKSCIFLQYVMVGSSNYLRPGLVVSGNRYLRLAASG